MKRRTRNRIIDAGCWLVLGILVGKTYAEHGTMAVANMLGLLVATLAILLVIIIWANRGEA